MFGLHKLFLVTTTKKANSRLYHCKQLELTQKKHHEEGKVNHLHSRHNFFGSDVNHPANGKHNRVWPEWPYSEQQSRDYHLGCRFGRPSLGGDGSGKFGVAQKTGESLTIPRKRQGFSLPFFSQEFPNCIYQGIRTGIDKFIFPADNQKRGFSFISLYTKRNNMKAKYKIGDKVKVAESCDNENYESFRDKILTVSYVSKNTDDHRYFDEGVNEPLYDFEGIPFSLYQYEIVKA